MTRMNRIVLIAVCAIACLPRLSLAQAPSSAGTDWRYTVRPADTVSQLSQRFLKPSIHWQALAQYNRLPHVDRILPGTTLRIPLPWLALQQSHAQVTAVAGEVHIERSDGASSAAQTGDLLRTGERIRVGRNSSARLQFADDSQMVIQPETAVVMDTLSLYAGGLMADTRLRLQSGRVEVRANPRHRRHQKFDILTPAAIASVRGTEFMVEASASRTTEKTKQGSVVLQTAQGQVMVKEGYASIADTGALPLTPQATAPAPVLQNPVARHVDFPIDFKWASAQEAKDWVMQIGMDPSMAELTLTKESKTPLLNAGALPNGHYHARAWSLNSKGLPSDVSVHSFEVTIPRSALGNSIELPAHYFSAGPIEFELPPAHGQRYLVQITRDRAGRQPVWHLSNAPQKLALPAPAELDRTHHLWVWLY